MGQDENLCKTTLLTVHWRTGLCWREHKAFIGAHLLYCLCLTVFTLSPYNCQVALSHMQSIGRIICIDRHLLWYDTPYFFLWVVERLGLLFSKLSLMYDQPALAAQSLVQTPRPISEDPSDLETSSSRCKSKYYKLSHLVFCNQSLLQSVISYCPVDYGGKLIPVQFVTSCLSICRHLLSSLYLFLIQADLLSTFPNGASF